jgi:hypothetical protein
MTMRQGRNRRSSTKGRRAIINRELVLRLYEQCLEKRGVVKWRKSWRVAKCKEDDVWVRHYEFALFTIRSEFLGLIIIFESYLLIR